MKQLPEEGGFYIETYRSQETIGPEALPERFVGRRSLGTAILYLLTANTVSKLHRLKSDEIFHFYLGDEVTMLQLFPDGSGKLVRLGNNLSDGERPQVLVPGGVWQGSYLRGGPHGYALMGTSVTPGFEFEDFTRGEWSELVRLYPDHSELIEKLT